MKTMILRIILILILAFVNAIDEIVSEYKSSRSIDEDTKLDTFSLIKKYGYPGEIHRVYTEDKYVLEMHRIRSENADAPVVFMQHGLLSSSAEWVIMTPTKGFAYILADLGYDVWLGNARGNTYSRKHVNLKPKSSAFWKFSWHEIGYYDLPAMINYVLRETGKSKLHYIGFSQGTTAFFVMTSSRPEYNDKIVAMHALAPVAFVGGIKSPLIKALGPFTNSLETTLKLLGANEFLPNGMVNDLAGQKLCAEQAISQILCTNILFLLCGFDDAQLNKTMLPVVLSHTPAGASTRQLIHYGQEYNSNKFRQYDHGPFKNKRLYGTFKPPAYNLSAISTPIFLHYSDNDWLSTPIDIDKLLKQVPSVVGKYKVSFKMFNHLDFVFGIDAKELIYDRIVAIMSYFNRN